MGKLKSAQLKIFVYDGTSGSYTTDNLIYTLSKDRISTQTNIIFEISDLVRDYIVHNFNDDYLCTARWVTTDLTLIDADTGVQYTVGGNTVTHNILMDGYGYYEDAINPQLSTNALITSNNIYIPENTAGKLPIFAEGVGKVVIDSATTQITDSGDSSQKIQYITIPQNSSTIQVFDTDDATILKTITVNNICEPKYTPFKVTFVNKYGAYQDVYFFKRTTETFNISDETHKTNNITESSVTYATNRPQRQRYNVNAQTSISLNTGFIKEDAKETIEELFLSEDVYIRFESKTLPITPKSKEFVHKTSLNDKLINYTVLFDFAFNKINNVR
mgnify:CR=1 FL=1